MRELVEGHIIQRSVTAVVDISDRRGRTTDRSGGRERLRLLQELGITWAVCARHGVAHVAKTFSRAAFERQGTTAKRRGMRTHSKHTEKELPRRNTRAAIKRAHGEAYKGGERSHCHMLVSNAGARTLLA